MRLELVAPSIRYRESFMEALHAFRREGLSWWGAPCDLAEPDFAAFVASRVNDSKTHLWAIADETFVGRLSIHHALTDALRISGGHIGYDTVPRFRGRGIATEMLRQGLEVARKLGLGEVLLTCDDTNVASSRVIEHNGGVLREKRELVPGQWKRYYWITLG